MAGKSLDRAKQLLVEEGLSVAEAAGQMGVSTSYLYEMATRHDLPTNAPIKQGTSRETQILRALVSTNMDLDAVGKIFRISPACLSRHLKAFAKRAS